MRSRVSGSDGDKYPPAIMLDAQLVQIIHKSKLVDKRSAGMHIYKN